MWRRVYLNSKAEVWHIGGLDKTLLAQNDIRDLDKSKYVISRQWVPHDNFSEHKRYNKLLMKEVVDDAFELHQDSNMTEYLPPS